MPTVRQLHGYNFKCLSKVTDRSNSYSCCLTISSVFGSGLTKSDFLNVIITVLVKLCWGMRLELTICLIYFWLKSLFASTIILQNNLFPALLQQPFPWSQILYQQQFQQKPRILEWWLLGRLDSRQLNLTTLRHFISPPPSIQPSRNTF